MKNQIFLSFLSFFFFYFNSNHAVYAQDVHHQEMSHELEDHGKPIFKINFLLIPFAQFQENAKIDYFMGPEIMLETKKMHHHLGYEMRSNSLNTLHGLKINKEYGIYGFFQKKLKKDNHHETEEHPDHILSLGFERFFLREELDRIVFFETGLAMGNDSNKLIFSFGIFLEFHILKFKDF